MSEETGAVTDTAPLPAEAPTETQDSAPQLSEVEELAFEMGWRPKGQYDGPEGNWRTAKDFLKRIPSSRDLKREIKSLRDQVDRMGSTATKQQERALAEQARQIQAKFDSAVENGDKGAAADAAKRMRELEAEATAAHGGGRDYEAEFAEHNPWYKTNRKARAFAISVSVENNHLSPEDQLAKVEEEVRAEFPELFQTAAAPGAKKSPPSVHAPTNGSARPNKARGFADLPAEARIAAEKFAEDAKRRFGKDPEATRKQYAVDYFADNS